MFTTGPLLRAHEGQGGDFPRWLEDLGLRDLLSRYPLRKLVAWGWLVPQHRVIFPRKFFAAWKNFPYSEEGLSKRFHVHALLWNSTWYIDSSEEPLWFLHPYFRPRDEAGRLLSEVGSSGLTKALPRVLTLQSGRKVRPYVDYFYHWQGYALIDVIRFADCVTAPVLNTPDLKQRVAEISRVAKLVKRNNPRDILTIDRRWGGFAAPMTWLSHYRAFRDALPWQKRTNEEIRKIRRDGAKLLADHFGISPEALSLAIKGRLLVLAQDWLQESPKTRTWTQHAWPYLQQDIAAAVEWLCYLTGKTLDDFLDEWRYRGHFGSRNWAELHKVLPHEFFLDRKIFLVLAPEYLKALNVLLPEQERLEGDRLVSLVDRLRSTNYPFNSFLGAFRQLHDELGYRYNTKGELDFRELRPLDYYSLLPIRAEQALQYAIERDSQAMVKKLNNLREYIAHFARFRGLSAYAVKYFLEQDRALTNLRQVPKDPIGRIMSLTPGLGEREDYLVKVFLSCTLARNYFTHHHYLDGLDLPRSDKSMFMLSGIVVTVLTLL